MPDAPPPEAATATGAGGSTLVSGTAAVLAICGGRCGAGGVDTVGVATTGLIICTLLGQTPDAKQVEQLRLAICTSYRYMVMTLDRCMQIAPTK